MKTKLYITCLAAALMSTSCADSFFDLEPNDRVVVGKVYTTASDFDVAVIGCYAKMQS